MNHLRTTLIAGLAMAAVASLASAGDDEVVLTDNETRTLKDGEKIANYQICVKDDKQAGAVMVMSGSTSKTLAPGECGTVTGAKITATPSKPLMGAAQATVTIRERD